MEIEDIINKLCGDIQPLCDETINNKRYANLYLYGKLYDYLTNELIECAKWKNDNRYSANKIGDLAYNILQRNQEQIEDELRSIDESEEE